MDRSRLVCALLLLLAGCGAMAEGGPRVGFEPAAGPAWRDTATAEDAGRIDRLGAAWAEGLRAARADGFGRRIASEGALLDPAAALPRPAPTPGAYLCRLVRLGGADRRDPAFAAFRPFYCFVGIGPRDQLSITKSEGSQRPAGYLWDDENPGRMIFLGTLALGSGPVQAYGEDRARDVAGIFERIGAFRYRLVIPEPGGAPEIDIFEMEPAPVQSDE
jgi:hypothetical protein